MNTRNLLVSLLTVWAATSLTGRSATLFVSPGGRNEAPYNSWTNAAHDIQTAVDAASDGDEIFVGDGTYVVSTQILISKGVSVRSANGPAAAIVSATGDTRCAYLNHANAILDGITITNGKIATYGRDGAARNPFGEAGSPTNAFAGGVYIAQGQLLNCRVLGNTVRAQGGSGGAGAANNFNANGDGAAGYAYGGGVYVARDAIIDRCIFANNLATAVGGNGGNYQNINSLPQNGNAGSGYAYGSAIYVAQTATILNSVFYDNSCSATGGMGGWAWSYGGNGGNGIGCGAVYCQSNTTIQSCTVIRNSASGLGGPGGGVNAGNPAAQPGGSGTGSSYGGGIYGDRDTTVLNSIVYTNSASVGPNYYGGATTYVNCCISPAPATGQNCFQDDPLLAPYTPDDFHLRRTSPCLDAGTNLPWMSSSHDIDGNPRIFGRFVDVGAEEASWGPKALDVGSSGTVFITWNTIPDDQYRFERSTNLLNNSWEDWGGVITAITERVEIEEPDASLHQAFYRAVATIRLTEPTLLWTAFQGSGAMTGSIWQARGNGRNPYELFEGPREMNAIAADSEAGKIFWSWGTASSNGSIWRADLDGGNQEKIVQTAALTGIFHMTVDQIQHKIYWAQVHDIRRANEDGSAIELVVHAAGSPRGLAVDTDDGLLFWSDGVLGKIWRSTLSGTDILGIVTNGISSMVEGVAVDTKAQKVYWADRGQGKISRANYDGSMQEDVVTNGLDASYGPYSLVIDETNDRLYWSVTWRRISRSNLDGSGIENVVTNTTPDACTLLY